MSNFALYLAGLRAVPPSAAQIVMQLSPVFVLLGGLIIFRESFARVQSLGVIGLFIGMALFFNQRYGELFSGMDSRYAQGLLTIALSSFLWSTFSLTQKQLLSYVSGRALLTVSYGTGIAVLTVLQPISPIVQHMNAIIHARASKRQEPRKIRKPRTAKTSKHRGWDCWL